MTTFLATLGLTALVLIGWAVMRARLAGFRAQRPSDYAGQGPAFDIRTELNGPILCEGVIYGPFGRVTSRFAADFQASWQGNVGTMTEVFTYDTGAVQHRHWTLTLSDDGMIRAEAPDVVGVGTGQQAGSAVLLRYRLRLAESAGGHVVDTTDWMYLTPNGTIMNRSQFSKFGIPVAELVATMRRKNAA